MKTLTDSEYEEYRKGSFVRTHFDKLMLLPPHERHNAAVMYWQLFQADVHRVLNDEMVALVENPKLYGDLSPKFVEAIVESKKEVDAGLLEPLDWSDAPEEIH